MFIPAGCVFDGIDGKNCDKSLNTEMTITVDEQKIPVKVCDKCSEDATPKLVREAYLKKKEELDAVIAQAKKLGLSISLDNNIAVATQPARPRQEPKQRQQLEPVIENDDDFIEVSDIASVINKNNNLRSTGNVPGGMGEHRINDQGALKGRAKIDVMEGRNGTPLVVPAIKQDMTGTTRINIKQTIDDQGLQKRFKDMADRSQREDVCFGQNGYTGAGGIRDCPICYGLGVTKNRGQQITCPRCAGSGVMPD